MVTNCHFVQAHMIGKLYRKILMNALRKREISTTITLREVKKEYLK